MTTRLERMRALSDEKAKLLELLIERKSKDAQQIKRYPRGDHSGSTPVPTSYAQRSLWFISQFEGGGAAYNIALLLRLRGNLDTPALQKALDALVQRQEMLRAVFIEGQGEPLQEILAEAHFTLKMVDLSGHRETQLEAQIRREGFEHARAPFDLRRGPLIRGCLLRARSAEHVLVIATHHIVSDGWSMGVFTRELIELYRAYSEGRPHSLKPLPIQYVDYAQWQREQLHRSALDKQLDYWRSRLEGAPPELNLPKDRPRLTVQGYRGQTLQVLLDTQLTAQLHALARRHGMTLFMVVYAAWAILLSRLSGQDDVVIGTPVANRRRTEFEGLIGLFVNTLALRIEFSADSLLERFFEQVKNTTLAAYDFQDVPFEQLVESLRPGRSRNRHPIFQVMLVLRSSLQREWKLPGLTAILQDELNNTSKFDLLLSLEEQRDQIAGSLNFDTDLFDCSTVERWLACLLVLLRSMTTGAQRPIRELSILPEGERGQLIEVFNASHVPFPQEKCIHQVFEEQVLRTPASLGVLCGQKSLTYAELNSKANQLARHLRSVGARAERPVAICMDRSVELMVGLLAIWKAGGAYVPLDPSYPIERLRQILLDAKPAILLTHRPQAEALVSAAKHVVTLDNWQEIAGYSSDNLDPAATGVMSHNLAYIIYTSGSTGLPKGVMVEHRNVMSLWQGLENVYRQSAPCRRIAVNASVNFDASVKQLVQLLSGRSVVYVPQEVRGDGQLMLRFMEDYRIDCIDCTPSQLKTWVAAGLLETQSYSPRIVLVGGEPIGADLWSRLARCGGTDFYNVYGPTESTVDATFARLRDDVRPPSIGLPMENRQIYILDSNREPSPIGVTGEMYIGGAGVARGYLNRPQLTAERFVVNPFDGSPNARLYRTGDTARWRADGVIEYMGRNDEQVKIRGIRIELGEVEAHIASHEAVAQVVVSARADVASDARLTAYIVPRDPGSPAAETTASVKLHLRRVLPEHMVPSAFVLLERFPLSASGKVNKRALPVPELGADAPTGYEAPVGEVEEKLALVWQEVLGLERVGRNDSFFDLGGHSLLVLKTLFNVNTYFRTDLKVVDFYRSPTIKELAVRIHGVTIDDPPIDLSKEAILEEWIAPRPGLCRVSGGAVLLTGATGFVGRFLLQQLLHDQSVIYCLVRAKSNEQAALRLWTELSKWGLWRKEFEARMIAVACDLRLPRLGLDDQTYATLCREVGTVYHCATSMNHLETYAMAKAANVGSAAEILRLATQHRLKLVNYISTLSVFTPAATHVTRVVTEGSSIEHELHRSSQGYVASKWVAERIFMTAGERGIPCNIFRLGLVWADAQQGRYDELQRVYRVLKSCLLSGLGIQDYRFETPPTPVDYVARAIVLLTHLHDRGGGIFHVASPKQQIGGLFEQCAGIVHAPIQLLGYYEWIQAMKQLYEQRHSIPAAPLIEFAFSMDATAFQDWQRASRSRRVQFDSTRTTEELRLAGLIMPALNEEHIRLCIEDMLARDEELKATVVRR